MKKLSSVLFMMLSASVASLFGQAPVITSFSPSTGNVGTVVGINGANFSTVAADNIVHFGATRGNVLAGSSTHLDVMVPSGATYEPITVTVNGSTANSATPFVVTFSNSNGSFGIRNDYWGGAGLRWGTVGDVDGDGKTDIIAVDEIWNQLNVWRNNTTTPGIISWDSFLYMTSFYTIPTPYGVEVEDLNGDGKLDVVVTNRNGTTVAVHVNNSSPGYISFAPPVEFETAQGPLFVSIRDLDSDGRQDIAVACANNFGVGAVSVLRNTSSGGVLSFEPHVDFEVGNGGVWCVKLEDMDGDGKSEILVTSGGSAWLSIFRNISTPGILNASSFAPRVDYTTGAYPSIFAVSDFDGDLKQDVVVGNAADNSMSLFRNISTPGDINIGSFTSSLIASPDPWNPTAGDVDGDGKHEIIVRNPAGDLLIYKNSSTVGSFSFSPNTVSVGGAPLGISVADLDGDEKADLAISNEVYNLIHVLQNIFVAPPVAEAPSFVSNTGFSIQWMGVENVYEYRVDVSTVADFSVLVDGYADRPVYSSPWALTKLTVGGLQPNTDYYCRVRAFNNGATSPNSNIVSVHTETHPAMASPNIWANQFGDWGDEEIQTMVSDDEGNIYAAGHFSGVLTFGSTTLFSQGDYDIFFVRLTPNGDVVWARSIGGPYYENEVSLAVDGLGLYMTAQFSGDIDVDPGSGTKIFYNEGQPYINDSFFARYNPADGSLVWARKLNDALSWSSSSIGVDKNGVYLTGRFNGSVDFNPGAGIATLVSQNEDVFLAKYNKHGNFIWVDAMGGTENESSWGLMVDGTGVYIHGYHGGAGDFDPKSGAHMLDGAGGFFGRYDLANGKLRYIKGIGNGTIFSMSRFGNHLFIAGDMQGAIDADPGNGVKTIGTDGFNGGFVGKYNLTDGKYRWAQGIVTSRFIGPRKVLADFSGVYVSGYFGGGADFDPGVGEENRSSVETDAFAAQYALEDGSLRWAKNIGSPGRATSIAATLTHTGYYLAGLFANTVNFDPYEGSAIRTSMYGGNDVFIAKYQRSCPNIAKPTITLVSASREGWTLKSSSSEGNQWYKNGELIASCNEQILKVQAPGNYSVQVSKFGCSSPMSETFFVGKKPTEYASSDTEISTDQTTLYPNPATEYISVDWRGFSDGPIAITVTDAFGKVLLTTTMPSSEQTIDVSRLPAGVYVFQAHQGAKFYTQRFIKK